MRLLLLGEIFEARQADVLRFAQRIIAVGHQLAMLSMTRNDVLRRLDLPGTHVQSHCFN